jgi:hypothetical protein
MFQFERVSQPLVSRRQFLGRLLGHLALAIGLLLASLGLGVAGYHYFVGLSWLDALLNAAMILGGMGPVDQVGSEGGKVFASVYALFAGIIFLVIAGVIIAPLAHRLLHVLHLEQEGDEDQA